jgi:hypothetical protein
MVSDIESQNSFDLFIYLFIVSFFWDGIFVMDQVSSLPFCHMDWNSVHPIPRKKKKTN